jgi:AcrR family transcriptional regulator
MGDRRRSTRALANDQMIRLCAVKEIARVGVDRLSLRDVGRVAGLTHGSTYARYEDVDELLIDVWNTTLHQRLVAMSLLSRNAAADPNANTFGELFELLRHADASDSAAIEMLLTSRRIPALREETEIFVRSHLEPSEASPEVSPRGVVLFGFMMVQILADVQFGFDAEYQSALEKLLLEAFGATTLELITSNATHDRSTDPITLGEDPFSPDQDLKSKLARATYDVVGKSGYFRATTSRISRRTACSPGAIYKFYRSKGDLIMGAFEGLVRSRLTSAIDLERMLEEGQLTALLNREVSDESERRRDFTLEMALAAAHSDAMRSVVWGQLIDCDAQQPNLIDADELRDQRFRYANRMVATVIVAAGWLATLTSATAFDMSSFAEPLRRGLVNQWFPDGAHS